MPSLRPGLCKLTGISKLCTDLVPKLGMPGLDLTMTCMSSLEAEAVFSDKSQECLTVLRLASNSLPHDKFGMWDPHDKVIALLQGEAPGWHRLVRCVQTCLARNMCKMLGHSRELT